MNDSQLPGIPLLPTVFAETAPVIAWPWWIAFSAVVLALVAVDSVTLHRRSRDPSLAEAAAQAAMWCLLALCFNGFIYWWRGTKAGTEFLTGYLLEWSMSMDNVFVFAVIFRYFHVPRKHQYRVLYWGIMGAIIMRLAFVLAGTALIARFEIVLPLFGAFLIYTAVQLARHAAEEMDPAKNLVLRWAQRWLPMAKREVAYDDQHFFGRQDGRFVIMPLFLVLLVIESTDVLFAVDSVPAIFGITRDPFIVFTSNICAILGLRALYFLLAGVMDLFAFLHYGLAAVLAFVGLKMVGEWAFPHGEGGPWIPTWMSLVIIAALLGVAVVASLAVRRT